MIVGAASACSLLAIGACLAVLPSLYYEINEVHDQVRVCGVLLLDFDSRLFLTVLALFLNHEIGKVFCALGTAVTSFLPCYAPQSEFTRVLGPIKTCHLGLNGMT